jgi:hypothetical protein
MLFALVVEVFVSEMDSEFEEVSYNFIALKVII